MSEIVYPQLQLGSFYEQLRDFCLYDEYTERNFLALHPAAAIRSLSWKEPFGTLMLPPYNKIETRKWDTKYRGWVLLCRSQVPYNDEQVIDIAGENQFSRIIQLTIQDNRFYSNKGDGQAFAIGRLVNSRPMQPEDADQCFVGYARHLYAHVYEDVHAIDPFYWKGAQGLRKVYAADVKKINIRQ